MAVQSFLIIANLASALALPLFGNVLSSDASDTADGTPSYSGSGRCPNGGTWTTFSDDFSSKTSEWNIESGQRGVSYGKDGVTLSLEQSMSSTGGIVIASQHSWMAPVKMSVELKTSGDPGIVNPFIFKGAGQGGDEIDLEIVEKNFLLPIWKQGKRLDKDQKGGWDVRQRLRHETEELAHDEYYYRYPGYNPEQWIKYEFDWETSLMLWTVDDNERVQFEKKSDRFPIGPLPIRYGIWSTDADQDWAGKVDWQKNPRPKMQARRFQIEGCRVD